MLETPSGARVFESLSNRRLRAYLSLAGALLCLLIAAAAFTVALKANTNLVAFHAGTTVPAIAAVALIASAFTTLRTPTRVVAGPEELIVLGGKAALGRWPWHQIALASTGSAANSGKRLLTLYDDAGKTLVKLTDDLADFDLLVAEIRRRMAEHPSEHRATVATRKGKRRGILLVLGGVAFLALAGANGWMAIHDQDAAELLKSQGKPATAIIVRKFTAPNGHTRRIEYHIDAPNAPTENVEINPALWPFLQEHQRLPAIAVPGRPDVSHLVTGQIDDDNMKADPKLLLLLSVVIGLFALLAIAAGLLNYRGLDLKWDKERGRPRLVPLGSENAPPR
jgi:hypothetical protein